MIYKIQYISFHSFSFYTQVSKVYKIVKGPYLALALPILYRCTSVIQSTPSGGELSTLIPTNGFISNGLEQVPV